jgi:hypothetical protein
MGNINQPNQNKQQSDKDLRSTSGGNNMNQNRSQQSPSSTADRSSVKDQNQRK